MAKQTFTTGQVLTAAQMTSLQQTAMLGGAASAKTASYTLVAADAGTAISMSNAGATTITVNTGLFAAGDTVHITNLGAGVCTITAGTATVNSSASLALAQYESGFLDFTSTSAAIFVKGAGAAATSGGITLISTTALTGSSITLSSIPTTYKNLKLIVKSYYASNQNYLSLRLNGDSGGTAYYFDAGSLDYLSNNSVTAGDSYLPIIEVYNTNSASYLSFAQIEIPQYTDTTGGQFVTSFGYGGTSRKGWNSRAVYNNRSAAITSITIFQNAGGTMSGGSVTLYGEA